MDMRKIRIIIGLSLLVVLAAACRNGEDTRRSELEIRLRPHCTPPDQYRNRYGAYRSPLLFDDGDSVRNATDWKRRRDEIREYWLSILGQWPPVMTDQKLEMLDTVSCDGYLRYGVRFLWTPVEYTQGYLLVPERSGRKAAVITLFYEPDTSVGLGGKPNRDWGLQLVRRGFVVLSLGSAQTTKDKTYSLYYPSIRSASMQPLSTMAYAAANAWEALAKVPEVDSARIGVMGHSYGGKWAMFASCLYDKFACAAWGDPGIVFDESKGNYVNYWEPWYLGYYPPPWKGTWNPNGTNASEGVYRELRQSGHDLHELHALMAPRPFLVSGGYSDRPERWIPLNHTLAVNRLLGYDDRVVMTNRESHDPDPEANGILCDFFEYWLCPDKRSHDATPIAQTGVF